MHTHTHTRIYLLHTVFAFMHFTLIYMEHSFKHLPRISLFKKNFYVQITDFGIKCFWFLFSFYTSSLLFNIFCFFVLCFHTLNTRQRERERERQFEMVTLKIFVLCACVDFQQKLRNNKQHKAFNVIVIQPFEMAFDILEGWVFCRHLFLFLLAPVNVFFYF